MRDDTSTSDPRAQNEYQEDAENHGGWWKVEKFDQIRDDVVIEFVSNCYAKATSSGNIVLGNPHPPGEGPDEEEIFTAVPIPVNQVAFKSGFGRYLGVDSRQRLIGVSEAMGETEMFLPIFEDNKTALCAYNECFITPDTSSDPQNLIAEAEKVGPNEMLTIRVNNNPRVYETSQKSEGSKTEASYQLEEGFIKKHGTATVSYRDDIKRLKRARNEGQLHEALLDTRVKHKSDKYCK